MSFIERYIKRPPALFPLVALFHIAGLLFTIYNASSEPITSLIWLQVLWMAGYTFAWIFCCAMKRWAAYTYIAITTASLLLHFLVKDPMYHSTMFLIDAIFAMILMAYIKRFD
ncbi:MAG TPA: hypothetical protein VGD89_13300 [Flavipsychrobacter sp.]